MPVTNYLLLIAGTFKSTKSVRGGPGPIMRNGRNKFENKTKKIQRATFGTKKLLEINNQATFLVKVSKLFNQIWMKLYAIKSQF